jgi:hypothetical protein
MNLSKLLPSKSLTSIRSRSTEGHSAFSLLKPGLGLKLLLVAVCVSLAGMLVSSFLALIYERQQLIGNAQAETTCSCSASSPSLFAPPTSTTIGQMFWLVP